MSSSFIGKVIDNYRILDNLGIGGMGVVFKAIHIKLDKYVALKMIAPGLSMNSNFIKRFQTEAKALAKLEDPNIVRIHDLRSDNYTWFIVMEYIDGINLSDKIFKEGALPWPKAVHILKQILSAIDHAHKAGIVHRDLKPNNVMITEDNTVKITDFGLAKDQSDAVNTMTIASGGTLYYMSPEHIKGISFTDYRSDIYSIGMTLYEMVTGKLPFRNLDSDFDIREMIMRKDLVKPSEYNPDIPAGLETIIMKTIAKNPTDRYESVEEMLREVEKFESSQNEIDLNTDSIAPEEFKREEIIKNTESADQAPAQDSIIEKKALLKPLRLAALLLFIIAIMVGALNIDLIFPSISQKIDDNPPRLTLLSSPAKALVFIDGDSIGKTPLENYALRPGRHAVSFNKDNYQSLDTTIYLGVGKYLSLSMVLDPIIIREEPAKQKSKPAQKLIDKPAALASLSIQSQPTNAQIWINGKPSGKTPLRLKNIKSGSYQIVIRKERFEDFSKRIIVKSGRNEVIKASLLSATGILAVSSDPAGASITIDGDHFNDSRTPITLSQLPVGKHLFLLEKQGFRAYKEEVEIKRNEKLRLDVKLVELIGKLSVQVKPWGSIYINDQLKKENTDIKYEASLPVKEYKVKIVHSTLGQWQKNIILSEGNTTEINIDFNALIPISITAFDEKNNPVWADIVLNNRDTGQKTPKEIKLRTGMHRLSVKKEGYATVKDNRILLVDNDFSEPQRFILKKIE